MTQTTDVGRGVGGGGDIRSLDEIALRAWTAAIQSSILEDRDITLTALALEMGISKERARQHLGEPASRVKDGKVVLRTNFPSEETTMRIEDAIDAISARKDLVPAQAMFWPEGALVPDWVSFEALAELEYRQEITTRYLMRSESVRLAAGRSGRRGGTRSGDRVA